MGRVVDSNKGGGRKGRRTDRGEGEERNNEENG